MIDLDKLDEMESYRQTRTMHETWRRIVFAADSLAWSLEHQTGKSAISRGQNKLLKEVKMMWAIWDATWPKGAAYLFRDEEERMLYANRLKESMGGLDTVGADSTQSIVHEQDDDDESFRR
jgi:hypothetical protein